MYFYVLSSAARILNTLYVYVTISTPTYVCVYIYMCVRVLICMYIIYTFILCIYLLSFCLFL